MSDDGALRDAMKKVAVTLTEHYCDFGRLFPHVRALREQIDWPALRRAVDGSPFARAFLALCDDLDLIPGDARPRPVEALEAG